MIKSLDLMKFWFEGCEGYIEFRFIGKYSEQRFVEISDLDQELLDRFVENGLESEKNVYFGVATRNSNKSGKEKDVFDVPGLWVDIDPKHADYSEALDKVSALPTPPSVIVSSGNGIHAYFKFEKPFRVNNENDFLRIKGLSTRMHKFLQADNTADLSRVLRLPDSWNVKDVTNKLLCETIEFSGVIYSIDDFEFLLNSNISTVKAFIKPVIKEFKTVDLEDLKVPKYILDLIVDGVPKGGRSEKVFAVVCSMLKSGHTIEEIAFVLTNPDWSISEKILERPHQHQLSCIEGTIKNAMERIENGKEYVTEQRLTIPMTEVYEKDGCYYRGEHRLSNFIFSPTERVWFDNNEFLKGEIIVKDGSTFPSLLNYRSLISKKDFLSAINSSKVSWLGGDKDIQYLRELMLTKQCVEKVGVSKIGLHGNLFITPDQVIDCNGIVENPNKVFVPKFYNNSTGLEQSIKVNYEDNWQEIAKNILSLLPQVNEEQVIHPILGWHMICPIAPLIRGLSDNGLPQLMMWGTKGSGKTSTAQLFARLFGNSEIRSCSRPAFSLMREMDTLNAIPLYLDEYRPNSIDRNQLQQIKNLALLSYKATSDSRGRQDQSTVDYQLTAPIVWIGETPFTDPNLLERIIKVKLTPNVFMLAENEYKEKFREINQLSLNSFIGGYVHWLLDKIINEKLSLNEMLQHHKEELENRYRLPERITLNIALMLIGLSLFEKLAGELEVMISPIPYELIANSQVLLLTGEEAVGSLEKIMEHTATMVNKADYFKEGTDYQYENGQLILATSSWLAALNKYCREYGFHQDIVAAPQLRNFLKENEELGGYVVRK